MILRILLLGDFAVFADETPVTTLALARVQALLAYLLLRCDAPQDRSRLAFLLWPDSSEAQAHTNLRKLLYQLRQAWPNIDTFLYTDKQSLQWRSASTEASFTLDTREFEQACARAEQAELAQDRVALRLALEQATRMYRGDLLPACYEEWIVPERERLRQLFLSSAQRLSGLLEQERDYEAAIRCALQLLRYDPLHEATYRQLMRLYALHGERAEALRAYHTCARLLERELGTEPSEITRAAYTSLMRSEGVPEASSALQSRQKVEAPLQGRKAEWRLLQRMWNEATGGIAGLQTGSPRLVLLTGEAGMGKTRLARELELWVNRLGMASASARCYAALEHLAYAPVTSWLSGEALQAGLTMLDPTSLTEIARLVPEVLAAQPQLSAPTAMSEGWQRQLFFSALVHAVRAVRAPLLLLLDDLQWCDQETLQWLQYLFAFAPDARLLLVCTARVEEVVPAHPLLAWLAALQRDGLVTEVPLAALALDEAAALAASIMDGQLVPSADETFYRESEGNPLFVVEMARARMLDPEASALTAAGGPLPLLTRVPSALPSAVQAVLSTRLARLSERARTVANVAAVIGREFAFPVLARASGEDDEEVVQGLDELWQRRVVREHGAGALNAYDFTHDKLREHIYAALSPVQRRRLHQRVADALRAVYSADLTVMCWQIAAHYERAGLVAQAIPFYQQAGQAASRIYAHAEALHAFEQAAALFEQARGSLSWEIIAQIHVARGDIYMESSAREEARQAYQDALAAIPSEANIWRARLHWKLATTWTYSFAKQHDSFYVKSRQAFEEAEHILAQVADAADSAWRDEWLALQFARVWRGSADEIEVALEKARPVVELYGTQEQRKLLAEAVGIHNAIRRRFVISARSLASWRANIAALESTGNEAQRAMDHALFGIGLLSAAQFDEAEEQLRQALYMGERTGNAWVQYNCLTFLPFVLRSRGQVEEMRHLLVQAESLGVALNNRIFAGHRAWVAWRDGDLLQAESYGSESVQEPQSQQIRPNPFLWTGRWPLIGVALAQDQLLRAIEHLRLLFEPTQQPPRAPLDTLLPTILRAWDAGEQAEAHVLLQQALPRAQELGYL